MTKRKRGRPPLNPKREPITHIITIKEVSYMNDQAFCSCGWESHRYWDGAEYAYDEWRLHRESP